MGLELFAATARLITGKDPVPLIEKRFERRIVKMIQPGQRQRTAAPREMIGTQAPAESQQSAIARRGKGEPI
jgi:hypothetical protein